MKLLINNLFRAVIALPKAVIDWSVTDLREAHTHLHRKHTSDDFIDL